MKKCEPVAFDDKTKYHKLRLEITVYNWTKYDKVANIEKNGLYFTRWIRIGQKTVSYGAYPKSKWILFIYPRFQSRWQNIKKWKRLERHKMIWQRDSNLCM